MWSIIEEWLERKLEPKRNFLAEEITYLRDMLAIERDENVNLNNEIRLLNNKLVEMAGRNNNTTQPSEFVKYDEANDPEKDKVALGNSTFKPWSVKKRELEANSRAEALKLVEDAKVNLNKVNPAKVETASSVEELEEALGVE